MVPDLFNYLQEHSRFVPLNYNHSSGISRNLVNSTQNREIWMLRLVKREKSEKKSMR